MTLIAVTHPSRNRVYFRRFDHEEARARWLAGESQSALAEEYGVTARAVQQACHPEQREHRNERHREAAHVPCDVCGATAWNAARRPRPREDGRTLCRVCAGHERRTRVRFDEDWNVAAIRCVTCEQWQPLENFNKGTNLRDLREGGVHTECKACNTRRRTAYRASRKVPCEDCGTPVEGKGRPNSRTLRGGGRVQLDPNRPYLCNPCVIERGKLTRRAKTIGSAST